MISVLHLERWCTVTHSVLQTLAQAAVGRTETQILQHMTSRWVALKPLPQPTLLPRHLLPYYNIQLMSKQMLSVPIFPLGKSQGKPLLLYGVNTFWYNYPVSALFSESYSSGEENPVSQWHWRKHDVQMRSQPFLDFWLPPDSSTYGKWRVIVVSMITGTLSEITLHMAPSLHITGSVLCLNMFVVQMCTFFLVRMLWDQSKPHVAIGSRWMRIEGTNVWHRRCQLRITTMWCNEA